MSLSKDYFHPTTYTVAAGVAIATCVLGHYVMMKQRSEFIEAKDGTGKKSSWRDCFQALGKFCTFSTLCRNGKAMPPEDRTEKASACRENLADFEKYVIDYSMHREHRREIVDRFVAKPKHTKMAAIILQGGTEISKYDTDTEYIFRQESFFHYLFGVKEPGCFGVIDLTNFESILFVPRLSDEWEIWCGKRKSIEFFQEHYGVDFVCYVDDLADELTKRGIKTLHRLHGTNSDSGLTTVTTAQFDGIERFTLNDNFLYPQLVECRVFKTEKELDLMRFVNRLSSDAHIKVMKTIRPNMMEYHAESTFLHHCYSYGGARLHAYTCICGAGENGATLHYGHAGAPNEKMLLDGDMFLTDMGAELHCYASDITCSYPVNGKFTDDQRMIYEGVLKAHDAVIAAMKPGVEWTDMHLLSQRVIAEHLLESGLFQNGSVDELMEKEIPAFFYPHGLGHMMGLDVHDVGGYPNGCKRSEKRILRKLRSGRKLEKNMVLTVEPGCYFIDALIDEVLSNPTTSKYINQDMLKRFIGTGGVRIESDVIVTALGAENMTQVPRTVEEIEATMRS